jgi:hypothetical protein
MPPLALRLNDWAWSRLPARAARFSDVLLGVLADGIHFSAWPVAGAVVPVAALVAGFAVGWTHIGLEPDQYLYIYSLTGMAFLLAISQHGAAVGLAAWIGYTAGDFLWAGGGGLAASTLLSTKALGAVVLAWPLVVTPLGVRGLAAAVLGGGAKPARSSARRSDARLFAAMGFVAAATFMFVFLWANVAPVLLQAVTVWRGQTPMTHGLVQAMHGTSVTLGIIAANAAALRIVLEFVADAKPALAARRAALIRARVMRPARRGFVPGAVGAVAKAFVITLMLATLLPTWQQAIVVFLILLAIMLGRDVVVGQLRLGPAFLRRGHVPMRFLAALALVYFVSYLLIPSGLGSMNGFLPGLAFALIAIALMAALVPVNEA